MKKINIQIKNNKMIVKYKDGTNAMTFKPHYWYKEDLKDLFNEIVFDREIKPDLYKKVRLP